MGGVNLTGVTPHAQCDRAWRANSEQPFHSRLIIASVTIDRIEQLSWIGQRTKRSTMTMMTAGFAFKLTGYYTCPVLLYPFSFEIRHRNSGLEIEVRTCMKKYRNTVALK
jgi:hypothetical protein